MKWTRLVGLLALASTTAGCATSAHRNRFDLPGERAPAATRATRISAPASVPTTAPAQGDDRSVAATTTTSAGRFDRFRLSHYLPQLGRPAPASVPALTTANPVVEVAARGSTPTTASVVAAAPARPSWLGFRRAKPPTTYLTDARGLAGRSAIRPTHLPDAGFGWGGDRADRAVLPTSAEAIAPTATADRPAATTPVEMAESATAAPTVPVPPAGDPPADASAPVEPPRVDQPLLAVSPIHPPQAATPASPVANAEAGPSAPAEPVAAVAPTPTPTPTESAATATTPAATPVAAPASVSEGDEQFPERLRGRPRLSGTSTSVASDRVAVAPRGRASRLTSPRRSASVAASDRPVPPPAEVAPASAEPTPAVARRPVDTAAPAPSPTQSGDPATVRAVPSAADPGQSLGLPALVLPASYARGGAAASAQGSSQSPPPPVLASPQVAPPPPTRPSPQGRPAASTQATGSMGPGGVVATATRAKTKFCRFLRQCLRLDNKK